MSFPRRDTEQAVKKPNRIGIVFMALLKRSVSFSEREKLLQLKARKKCAALEMCTRKRPGEKSINGRGREKCDWRAAGLEVYLSRYHGERIFAITQPSHV